MGRRRLEDELEDESIAKAMLWALLLELVIALATLGMLVPLGLVGTALLTWLVLAPVALMLLVGLLLLLDIRLPWRLTYVLVLLLAPVCLPLVGLSALLTLLVYLLLLLMFGLVDLKRSDLKWMQIKTLSTSKRKSKSEDWAKSFGWFIPRKYRHVIGDILEDCAEMRQIGCTERRIKFHVFYQWLIAVITLIPTAIKTSITDILKQVISPPK